MQLTDNGRRINVNYFAAARPGRVFFCEITVSIAFNGEKKNTYREQLEKKTLLRLKNTSTLTKTKILVLIA